MNTTDAPWVGYEIDEPPPRNSRFCSSCGCAVLSHIRPERDENGTLAADVLLLRMHVGLTWRKGSTDETANT